LLVFLLLFLIFYKGGIPSLSEELDDSQENSNFKDFFIVPDDIKVGDILFCDIRPFFLNIWEKINISEFINIEGYSNDHCAMYIGNNKFIESAPYMYKPFKDEWRGVVISPYWKINLWATNITFAYVDCDQKIRNKAVEWAKTQLRCSYEVGLADGNPNPGDLTDENADKWFCSELIWAAYWNNNMKLVIDWGSGTYDAYYILALKAADQVIWYENQAPVSKINGPSEGFVDEELIFDANNSYDIDEYGEIMKYTWNIEDNTTYGKRIYHIFQKPGNYSFSLTVKDAGGKTDMDNFTVKILAKNREPLKPMIIGNHSGKVHQEMNFSFYAEDPDNDLIQYTINWGDSMKDESEFVENGTYYHLSHQWSEPGFYNLEVKVNDYELSSKNSTNIEILLEDYDGSSDNKYTFFILLIFGCIGVVFIFLIKKRYY